MSTHVLPNGEIVEVQKGSVVWWQERAQELMEQGEFTGALAAIEIARLLHDEIRYP